MIGDKWYNHPFSYLVYAVITFIVVYTAIYGPTAISRDVLSWKAQAYGTDWLVVQYSSHGDVINVWKLEGNSITSEKNSDGIYFAKDDGNVVHVGGHYNYVQIENENWEQELDKLTSLYKRNSQ